MKHNLFLRIGFSGLPDTSQWMGKNTPTRRRYNQLMLMNVDFLPANARNERGHRIGYEDDAAIDSGVRMAMST